MSKVSTSISAIDLKHVEVISLTTGGDREPFIVVDLGKRETESHISIHLTRHMAEVLSDKLAVALASPICDPMKKWRDENP